MSLSTYFKQSETITFSGTNYSYIIKTLAETLVSIDDMLSIGTVLVDNGSVYDVFIRISDTQQGIRLHNLSSYANRLYLDIGYLNDSGSFVSQMANGGNAYRLGDYSYCVFSWGLGDCIRNVGISGSYSTGFYIGAQYKFFMSSTSINKMLVLSPVGGTSVGFPGLPMGTPSGDYLYDTERKVSESIYFSTYDVSVNAFKLSGLKYAMVPYLYQAYTSTKGFLNLRWGESHRLYSLYSIDGSQIYVRPGNTVSINSVSVMSIGPILIGM